MSRKDSGSNRRKVLQMTGSTLAAFTGFAGSVSAKSPIPVRTLKGTPNNPIKKKHIEREREVVLNRLRAIDDSPESVILDRKPVPDKGTLAGYAISMKNGAPVEKTYPVSSKDDSIGVLGSDSSDVNSGRSPKVIREEIKSRHNVIDKINSKPSAEAVNMIGSNNKGGI